MSERLRRPPCYPLCISPTLTHGLNASDEEYAPRYNSAAILQASGKIHITGMLHGEEAACVCCSLASGFLPSVQIYTVSYRRGGGGGGSLVRCK